MTETLIHLSSNYSNGRWTKFQHQQFLIGLSLYGKNWQKIQELMKTRSGSQIRSHAQKYFLKSKKKCEEKLYKFINIENLDSQQASLSSKLNSNNSFFQEHVVPKTVKVTSFDLWNNMIDQKLSKTPLSLSNKLHSFVNYNGERQKKYECMANYKLN